MNKEIEKIRDVTDIIELQYLQEIQNAFGKVTKITTAVLDPQGVPITAPTNLYAFCEMMQASESGVQMCMVTNSALIEKNKKTRKPAVVVCPNSGLKTASVPIFLGDRFLGSWLIGQIRTDEIDLGLIEKTAVKAGLSKEMAKQNFSILPVISEEEFQNILEFLSVFTKEMVHLVEMNYEMRKKDVDLLELSDRLHSSANTFEEFIDLADIGVYVVDFFTGELLMTNKTYAELVSSTPPELVGHKCFHQIGFDDWCPFCPKDSLLNDKGEPGEPVVWENYLEMADRWLRITNRAIRWTDGRLAQMITFLDITERKKQEEEMAYLAYYDQRLDIPNGTKLFMDLKVHEVQSISSQIICFDIQGLRKINDAYGRETGDGLLKAIRDWMAALGEGTELYRVDGDEFALLVTDRTDDEVLALAKKIWNRFEEIWSVELAGVRQHIFASISLGIIPTQSEYKNYASLLNIIERILFSAKEKGRPLRYDTAFEEEFKAHLKLELKLRESVLDNMKGFTLHYQPIVDAISGIWVGVEALCRWEDKELGAVPPVVFITEVEQMGLVSILGEWVLREAVSQVKKWKPDEIEGFMLDVNLSPLQLADRGLLATVGEILDEFSYPAEKLSLEITESAEVPFDEYTLGVLRELRAGKITLSLDDFGTGYAGFSNLNHLPVDFIKVDRSFVTEIETDLYLQHTVRTMVEFAHATGMKVVAEGVETEGQMRVFLRSGVDFFQGYYFDRPLEVSALRDKMDHFFG